MEEVLTRRCEAEMKDKLNQFNIYIPNAQRVVQKGYEKKSRNISLLLHSAPRAVLYRSVHWALSWPDRHRTFRCKRDRLMWLLGVADTLCDNVINLDRSEHLK